MKILSGLRLHNRIDCLCIFRFSFSRVGETSFLDTFAPELRLNGT